MISKQAATRMMTDNERIRAVFDAQKRVEAQQDAQAAHDAKYGIRPIKILKQYQDTMTVAGTGAYSAGYNATMDADKRMDPGTQVSKFTTAHGHGFWSVIRITDEDVIYYKLFKGRWSLLLYKLGIRSINKVTGWDYIENQGEEGYKLEAELGKTYLEIDSLIAEALKEKQEKKDHKKFIKGIASTDPENLKAIAGLKKLDEGLTKPLEEPQAALPSPPSQPSGTTSTKYKQQMVQYDYATVKEQLEKDFEDLYKTKPEPDGGEEWLREIERR